MKKVKKYFSSIKIFAALGLVLLISACVYLDTVDVPASGKAGEVVTMVINGHIDAIDANTSKLVVGFMAPKSWNIKQNTNISYVTTLGSGNMSLVPDGTICPNSNGMAYPDALKTKFGIGGNLIDDVEWVAWQSNVTYIIKNGDKITVKATLKTKLGPENLMAKLGFYYGSSSDGLGSGFNGAPLYASMFSSCFLVTDGEGDLIDFCNPQIAAVEPAKSTDNDLITVTFDNGLITTPLTGMNDIYICAKGFLADGGTIDVCAQEAKSKMTPLNAGKFRLDFWPRGYFKLNDNQSLTRIEYYFTNADGNIKVGYGGSETTPIIYTFRCN